MNKKILRAMVAAETDKGKIRTWVTLDAAAKWIRSIGVGRAHIQIDNWQPNQREIDL